MPFLHIQILVALSLAFVLFVGFFGLDYRNLALFNFGASMWVPAAPFEDSIPFLPAWIWVYIAYYPLCFSPLAVRELQIDRETFWRVVGAYLFQFGVGFAVFWLIPSRMIRPEPAGGYCTSLALTLTYRLDPGFNIFPSMHVCNLVYTAWFFRRFLGNAWGLAMGSAALLVSLSTLFVKQHYVADVMAGAVLGTLTFFLLHPRAALHQKAGQA
ncbi:MAG: phosphatase PAP2 family protein [Elusimicrobia bacterium]|nr:phosphatase PAP2 family protein [Elusimicrobiota bacterium]